MLKTIDDIQSFREIGVDEVVNFRTIAFDGTGKIIYQLTDEELELAMATQAFRGQGQCDVVVQSVGGSYHCTRGQGHSGWHIAHAVSEVGAIWK